MTVEDAIRRAAERARRLKVDPQVTVAEAYEAEILLRLQKKLRGEILLKGGTVLRLLGSERFSRDLDASRRSASLTPRRLKRVLETSAVGLPYLSGMEIKMQAQSVTSFYRFLVPNLGQPLRIAVEVSLREKVLLPPATISTARIAHPVGLEPVVVARLDDRELLAEKVRALVMRLASRDIYDVYWLMEQGIELDAEVFLEKMRYYERAGRPVDALAAMKRTRKKLAAYDPGRGKTELANMLPAAERRIDFAIVVEDVSRTLGEWIDRISSRKLT